MTAYAAICDEGNLHKIAYRLKLDANQVEAMKNRIADGESKASVAKSLGITRTTLYEYLK